MDKRFQNSNQDDVSALKEASTSKNTKHSTFTWVNAFDAWSKARNLTKKLFQYEPKELNKTLEKFYTELRKKDGTDYEPACLRTMIGSLDRYV